MYSMYTVYTYMSIVFVIDMQLYSDYTFPRVQWQFLSRDEGEQDTACDPSWIEDEGMITSLVICMYFTCTCACTCRSDTAYYVHNVVLLTSYSECNVILFELVFFGVGINVQ